MRISPSASRRKRIQFSFCTLWVRMLRMCCTHKASHTAHEYGIELFRIVALEYLNWQCLKTRANDKHLCRWSIDPIGQVTVSSTVPGVGPKISSGSPYWRAIYFAKNKSILEPPFFLYIMFIFMRFTLLLPESIKSVLSFNCYIFF